jgi:predicted RNase H-like HicB family nuclease
MNKKKLLEKILSGSKNVRFGDFVTFIPDLTFCSAFGETPEEVLHEVQLAKEAWLETARHSGKPIPKPQYRPAIYHLYTPLALSAA